LFGRGHQYNNIRKEVEIRPNSLRPVTDVTSESGRNVTPF